MRAEQRRAEQRRAEDSVSGKAALPIFEWFRVSRGRFFWYVSYFI